MYRGKDNRAEGLQPGVAEVPIRRAEGSSLAEPTTDFLAVEEPLEIRLEFGPGEDRQTKTVSVTMRTPGYDFELAAGFLWTEGILGSPEQIEAIRHSGIPTPEGYRNVVRVALRADVAVDLDRLERHFYTTSSCGVCGKTSLEAVQVAGRFVLPETGVGWPPSTLHNAPGALREAQAVFDRTGGLHAAALFDPEGKLLCLREDVGRHNAVDKLVGAQLLAGALPLIDRMLLVSGRASFELVQKAMTAGIPLLAAVGAPSSLAVDLARRSTMTLVGFVRNHRFNIYTGAQRIEGLAEDAAAATVAVAAS